MSTQPFDDMGLADIVARACGLTVEQLRFDIDARRRARAQAAVRANARYEAGLEAITDIQAVRIDHYQRNGCRQTKLLRSRASGREAVMLQKDKVWTGKRIGIKLVVVYPDGSATETFERTISIKQNF